MVSQINLLLPGVKLDLEILRKCFVLPVMLPVSLAPRTGIDAYSPLGTVIVWGLIAGTVLSLLVIPVMHSLIDDTTEWVNQRAARFKQSKRIEG